MKFVRILALLAALAVTATFLAACGDGKDDDKGPEASPTEVAGENGDEEVELDLRAENVQFDKNVLEAPAGAVVALTLDNRDDVAHSFSLFESEESEDALFKGDPFSGPSFLIYQFTAPTAPGTYHFHCDIHPDVMKGDFVVE